MNFFTEKELDDLSYCPKIVPGLNRAQIRKALIKLGEKFIEIEEEIKKDHPSFEIRKALNIYCENQKITCQINDKYLSQFEGLDIQSFHKKIRDSINFILDPKWMTFY